MSEQFRLEFVADVERLKKIVGEAVDLGDKLWRDLDVNEGDAIVGDSLDSLDSFVDYSLCALQELNDIDTDW